MKKKVTNTHKEPIVLPLLRPQSGCKFEQRAHENLNIGASCVMDESEVSPEMVKMQKRGKLLIEDMVNVPLPLPPVKEVVEAAPPKKKKTKKKELATPQEEEKSIEEQELLNEGSNKPLDD